MTIKEFKVQYALGTLTWQMKTELARDSTSTGILTTLSKDANWLVRAYIAENPNTPTAVLTWLLSKDEDEWVRCRAVNNPNTSLEVFTIMKEDRDPVVKYYAIKRFNNH